MNNVIDAIRKKRAEIDKAEYENNNLIEIRNKKALERINGFLEDFKELKAIADEMQSNRFTLGRVIGNEPSPRFITNWWSHKVGFYPIEHVTSFGNQIYNLKGFGVMNGGACGNVDLVIDFDGKIVSYGRIYSDGTMADVIEFANNFKAFRRDFLDYVTETFA